MPVLFKDMIKCIQNDLELTPQKKNLIKITTIWIKCFCITNRFQQVFKAIISLVYKYIN